MIFMRHFSKTILAIGSVKVFATQIITEGFRKATLFLTLKDDLTLLYEVAVSRFVVNSVFRASSRRWASSDDCRCGYSGGMVELIRSVDSKFMTCFPFRLACTRESESPASSSIGGLP